MKSASDQHVALVLVCGQGLLGVDSSSCGCLFAHGLNHWFKVFNALVIGLDLLQRQNSL